MVNAFSGNEGYARNEVFAATTSSQTLSPAQDRQTFTIRNSGTAAETLTISFGQSKATALAGIVLTNGQAYTESNSEGFECWSGDIQVIVSSNCNVSIFER